MVRLRGFIVIGFCRQEMFSIQSCEKPLKGKSHLGGYFGGTAECRVRQGSIQSHNRLKACLHSVSVTVCAHAGPGRSCSHLEVLLNHLHFADSSNRA